MNTRKIFLIAFVCSVVAAAGIGIFGIITDNYGGDEQLLGTMASLALFSLTALGTAIVLDKRRWPPLMWTSFVISALGLAGFLFMIYFDREFDWLTRLIVRRGCWFLATIAIALPLGGLLALTRFDHPALSLFRIAGISIVYITAFIICAGILSDPDNDYFRLLGVALILTGLAVVSLPALHKVAGMPPPSETVASDLSLTIICPRCALSQSIKPGTSRCQRCRLKFTIEVEEPRCPKCRYLLYQLTEPRCPECGTPIDGDDLITSQTPIPPAVQTVPASPLGQS
jgi:hypothetical protein